MPRNVKLTLVQYWYFTNLSNILRYFKYMLFSNIYINIYKCYTNSFEFPNPPKLISMMYYFLSFTI